VTDVLGEVATRQIQWHVSPLMVALLYASMSAALVVFAYGFWRRIRVWRLGRPEVAWDHPWARLRRTLIDAGAQASVLRDRLPGAMHALIYFGFLVLFAATVVVFIDFDLGIPIMRGAFYLYFQSLTVDLFGLLLLIGIAIAAYRRYVLRPSRLEHGNRADALMLGWLALILVTGFLLEGMRIQVRHDPWASWSPVGYVTGLASHGVLGSNATLKDVYPWLWVFHVFLWHGLLATIPFTKLIHMVTSPLNVYFANPGPAHGVVAPTNFEDADVKLGIRTPFDMSWRQLLALDACTECGRCEAACPAFAAGKPLSPKRVILDLRDHVRGAFPQLREADSALGAGDETRAQEILQGMPPLAGGVIKPDTLWSCTTCRACEESCPVRIEHVPLIIGLRQNLAMEQAAVPSGVADAMANLEARQHPFRGANASRTDWLAGLEVDQVSSLEEVRAVELVYWVGCAAAFDERAQLVARALVTVLQHARVKFAVFSQESCNGDVARRTGNEFDYSMLARANVEALNGAGVERVVTHCPHCLQQLRHEYEQFGGRYTVVHHSELVSSLIEQGRIRLAPGARERVTYHDPCYLGRYNREFDAPRAILDALAVERVEMPRSRTESFCCGAGGGHAFFDDADGGEKINAIRAREASATGATTVVTGCPFCLTMLASGARAALSEERPLQARDFVELVADALID
jgi:Fe-S oxidoreductase/nitrate reductase gamma subunit